MLKYYYRLQKIESSFPLLQDAFLESKSLHETKNVSWYSALQTIIQNISTVLNIKTNRVNIGSLREYFIKEWSQQLGKSVDGKLSMYVFCKSNFGFEKYLTIIRNFEQRRRLTRFRMSAHKLAIETGRYKGIPRHNRICTRCSRNEIEDEAHFLFNCDGMINDRYKLESIINKNCANFRTLDQKAKTIWLLNTENTAVLYALCDYLKVCTK